MTRTFVAVFPAPDVVAALERLRARLEPRVPGLRWTAAGNLHFTLRFFGDLEDTRIQAASRVISAVTASARPFPLRLAGVGVFGGWRRPRVLWVGVAEGGDRLRALARELDRGFAGAGLGAADRPFRPHLTLGRWREPLEDPRGARAACDAVGAVATFPVTAVRMMGSVLNPGGPRYRVLAEHPLSGA